MQSFKDFIDETFKSFDDQRKLRRSYLYAMTKNLDKSFIVDLVRIYPRLLNVADVLRESIAFLDFLIQNNGEVNITSAFNNYLVS